MKPSIGRAVIFHLPETAMPINGTREHPAIVTRVWTEADVNLIVFFDGAAPASRCSVKHASVPPGASGAWWDWPIREEATA